MESAMNSTLVFLALYICSILHNGHKTIIEFIARLPQEREEVINVRCPTFWRKNLAVPTGVTSHLSQMANVG
jgi:hypothetical protein